MMTSYLPEKVRNHIGGYVWGKVREIHDIHSLKVSIVEYVRETDDKTLFHPYINHEDTSVSYESLDRAIVGAILIIKHGKEKAHNGRYPEATFRVMEI